jgi:alcohol dehydrogenase (NADP+)
VTGYRQYCAEARGFAFSDLDQGAFGSARIIHSAFAYKIPDAITSADAAPFMCAGASTYEALIAAGTTSNDHVGVVGIGGLGHMAILFAKAMGCAVTAISSSNRKVEDAFKLGADDYRSAVDIGDRFLPAAEGRFSVHNEPQPMNINVLLITSNEITTLEPFMPLLAGRATIVLMTIQQQPLSIPYMPFVLPGHRLIASTEASRENHIKMLEFTARHRIKPWVEEFPMTAEGIAAAFERLETGNMRYRGVLVREAGSSQTCSHFRSD